MRTAKPQNPPDILDDLTQRNGDFSPLSPSVETDGTNPASDFNVFCALGEPVCARRVGPRKKNLKLQLNF